MSHEFVMNTCSVFCGFTSTSRHLCVSYVSSLCVLSIMNHSNTLACGVHYVHKILKNKNNDMKYASPLTTERTDRPVSLDVCFISFETPNAHTRNHSEKNMFCVMPTCLLLSSVLSKLGIHLESLLWDLWEHQRLHVSLSSYTCDTT